QRLAEDRLLPRLRHRPVARDLQHPAVGRRRVVDLLRIERLEGDLREVALVGWPEIEAPHDKKVRFVGGSGKGALRAARRACGPALARGAARAAPRPDRESRSRRPRPRAAAPLRARRKDSRAPCPARAARELPAKRRAASRARNNEPRWRAVRALA